MGKCLICNDRNSIHGGCDIEYTGIYYKANERTAAWGDAQANNTTQLSQVEAAVTTVSRKLLTALLHAARLGPLVTVRSVATGRSADCPRRPEARRSLKFEYLGVH